MSCFSSVCHSAILSWCIHCHWRSQDNDNSHDNIHRLLCVHPHSAKIAKMTLAVFSLLLLVLQPCLGRYTVTKGNIGDLSTMIIANDKGMM